MIRLVAVSSLWLLRGSDPQQLPGQWSRPQAVPAGLPISAKTIESSPLQIADIAVGTGGLWAFRPVGNGRRGTVPRVE